MKPLLRSLFAHLQSLAHGLAGRVEPRIANALLVEAGARATWRALRPIACAGRAVTGTRARDDFTSEVERRRFRSMGPLRAEEIAALDLDQLLRRLAESG